MAPKPLHQGSNSESEMGESEECLTPLQLKAKAGSGGKMLSNGKIFSEEDIVFLLNRLAVFWADGKSNKWVEFHRFVKDDLSKEYSSRQVSEKIRRLHGKFKNARVKPSNPHESTVYDLSKVLWEHELNDQNNNKKSNEHEANTNLAIGESHERIKHKKNRKIDEGDANTILASSESHKKIKHKKNRKSNEDEANTNLAIGELHEKIKHKKKRKIDEGDTNTILASSESYKKTNEGEANTILPIGESYKKLKHQGHEDEIGLDEFESSYPYLCASFKMPGCPLLSIKECASIGRKYANELEDEWKEHKAQQLRFELKKLTN